MSVFLARRWRNQPTYPVQINEQSSLSVNLRRVFFPANGFIDPVDGGAWSVTGTPNVDIKAYGAIRHLHGTSYINRLTPKPTAGWTMGCIYVPINGTASGIIGFNANGDFNTFDRNIRTTGSPNAYQASLFDGGTKTSGGAGGTLTAGKRDVVVGRCTAAFSLQLWYNGVGDTATACANNGFGYGSTPVFGVGKCSTSAATDGGMQIAFYADRAWSQEEIISWSEAPYQVFKRDPMKVFFFVSGGGGGATTYNDSLTFAETNALSLLEKYSFKDSLTYSETNSFTPTVNMSFKDSLTYSETNAVSFTELRTFKDSLTFSETNTYAVTQGAIVASVTFTTTQGVTFAVKQTSKDALTFSETNALNITHLAKLSDALVFAETNTVSAVGTIAGLSLTYSLTAGWSLAETLSSAPTPTVTAGPIWTAASTSDGAWTSAATTDGIWTRATTATGSWTLQ